MPQGKSKMLKFPPTVGDLQNPYELREVPGTLANADFAPGTPQNAWAFRENPNTVDSH